MKSPGQMVWFSIKPGDQTDKTESPNLVSKTGLAKRREPKLSSRLFKFFEFENGRRMSDEKLIILEFKYLQNKK